MTTSSLSESCSLPRYELYAHGADIGIRGFGADPAQAFEAAALALTSAICSPAEVFPNHCVELHCQAADLEDLLYEWINALVYEMATRRMLFSRFRVTVVGLHLGAEAWGEPLDIQRHQPAVEVKGATYTDLRVIESRPGMWRAAYAMPDAHWGYGFPIGGVAAFDPEAGGIISAGGVGFDISCGVRTLLTGLTRAQFEPFRHAVADELARAIPAGMGHGGRLRLNNAELAEVLTGGARWAVEHGYGRAEDLEHIEEGGQILHAKPGCVSARAYSRQHDEVGTLGSGNHYLEVQVVTEVYRPEAASALELERDCVVVTIHCGSRGLGHQIGTDYLAEMVHAAPSFGIRLPDRELACAPIKSDLGQRYLGAMRAAANCALANRQVLTHMVRESFSRLLPAADIRVLYDVSHNICKEEMHAIDGRQRRLFVHRKGATRAFGPGNPAIPEAFRAIGQPVLIGGSMGTGSFVLVGTESSESQALSSACHGAGRSMSRTQAAKRWKDRELIAALAARNILIRSPSMRGVAEEAPEAYKSVDQVVDAAEAAGLASKVARLEPLLCIKG